jgi:hypothetical protein
MELLQNPITITMTIDYYTSNDSITLMISAKAQLKDEDGFGTMTITVSCPKNL